MWHSNALQLDIHYGPWRFGGVVVWAAGISVGVKYCVIVGKVSRCLEGMCVCIFIVFFSIHRCQYQYFWILLVPT